MKKLIYICCLLLAAGQTIHTQQTDFSKLTGPYLGQKPPGMTPEIFAPGVVSSEHQEHSSLAFSPDGREYCPFIAPDESFLIFSRDCRRFDSEGKTIGGDKKLMISYRNSDGTWLEAIDMGPLFANTRFPSVSPDGKYLFFTKFTEGSREDFYWVDAKIIKALMPKK